MNNLDEGRRACMTKSSGFEQVLRLQFRPMKLAATVALVLALTATGCGTPTATSATPVPTSVVTPTPTAVAVTTAPASPTASASPTPTGFVLPAGCSYVGSPVVGSDYSQWRFDCGAVANHDARGTLAPAFVQQGWMSCGVGLGSGTWKKADVRLIVSEGSGVPGPSGLPVLSQPANSVQIACG